MPEADYPYAPSSGSPWQAHISREMLNLSVERRRMMLWSALVTLVALVLVGTTSLVPWFLLLVPLTLLAVWNACLLVQSRKWRSTLEVGLREGKASAERQRGTVLPLLPELGIRDLVPVLAALASPSILGFHGILLATLATAGWVEESGKSRAVNGIHNRALAAACECDNCKSLVKRVPSQAIALNTQPPRTFPVNSARPPGVFQRQPQQAAATSPVAVPPPTSPPSSVEASVGVVQPPAPVKARPQSALPVQSVPAKVTGPASAQISSPTADEKKSP